MYINERDQINYHGFLRALREMHQVPQESVSKGICTISGMNRFENGNRMAEKLMRDRLTARLGISGEKYEEYLQPNQYVKWEQRLRIVKAIEKRELAVAKRELEDYESQPAHNCLNKQFIETMRFMILSIENAPEEELLDCVKRAVKYTVPNVNKALAGAHLLADQEINLIAEQMRLTPPKKVIRDVTAWRICEYEKLIAYIDNSSWENLQKAKVYPKIVYYICQLLLQGEPGEGECRHALELCNHAIELLRDAKRLYYFIELTETRRAFAERLMACDIAHSEKNELEEMLSLNNSWEKVLKELYAEYKVEPYMSDFGYLYYENECHDMVQVIETRRKMLGLSRIKLADGICTDRTIIRFEREGRNPNVDLVRLLFEKMGLCAEYRRARVITNDVEALMLSIELGRNINKRELEQVERNLQQLESKLYMSIPYNKQEISRWRGWLLLFQHKIDNKEFHSRCQSILEYSIPINCIGKNGSKFFTREEWQCLFGLAFETSGELAEMSEKLIENRCFEEIDYENISADISLLEMLAGGLESYLGNMRRYEDSLELGNRVLELVLRNRKMNALPNNLYSNIWNSEQLLGRFTQIDQSKKSLEKCIILSELIHKSKWAKIYAQKLDELESVN